jgi:SagB-type dehydrogenase family enzyme
MVIDDGTTARLFHEKTKHSHASVQRGPHTLDWENRPLAFKIYRDLQGEAIPRSFEPGKIAALTAIMDPALPREGEIPDRAALGRLLYYSLGILRRRQLGDGNWHDFRAAPCTGALYHVDAYIVCGDLPDLTAGVYHFDPREFVLQRLRLGDFRSVLVEATSGEARVAAAPVVLVLASTYWRNSWKYRQRAYRHVFWDGGTVIAQLLGQAAVDRWTAKVVLGFADAQVESLCGLDSRREGVIAILPIGGGSTPPPLRSAPDHIHHTTEPLSPREFDFPEIREIHAATALADSSEVRDWRAAAVVPARTSAEGSLLPLRPDLGAAVDPLEAVIRRRGSTRMFARRTISSKAFANLLSAASAPLDADYRATASSSLVELFVIVNAVEGVPSGSYRWHGPEGALEQLSLGDLRAEAGYLALGQALGADAAVDVYAIADLDHVFATLGTRGYRAAQLDGGISGGRLYLAAFAQGIGATGLTFFDDDVAEIFGLDPARFGVMFLTAAGMPSRP